MGESFRGWFAETAIAQIPSWFEQTGNLLFLRTSQGACEGRPVKEGGPGSVEIVISPGSSKE